MGKSTDSPMTRAEAEQIVAQLKYWLEQDITVDRLLMLGREPRPEMARAVASHEGSVIEYRIKLQVPKEERELPYTGQDEHPKAYEGPCGCDLCRSYGAED